MGGRLVGWPGHVHHGCSNHRNLATSLARYVSGCSLLNPREIRCVAISDSKQPYTSTYELAFHWPYRCSPKLRATRCSNSSADEYFLFLLYRQWVEARVCPWLSWMIIVHLRFDGNIHWEFATRLTLTLTLNFEVKFFLFLDSTRDEDKSFRRDHRLQPVIVLFEKWQKSF